MTSSDLGWAGGGGVVTLSGVRGWVIWGAGVVVYAVAVFGRTTFGVAGVDAAARFGAPAAVLSTFVVLQLVVYAGLQVPVGVLLDRFGSRALMSLGASIMFAGHLGMAVADTVPEGAVARVLVGAGDSMTFGSVIRLVPAWFPARRVPLITQITGLLGQSGQLASAIPFAYALHHLGWSASFLGAAFASATATVLGIVVVRNAPGGSRVHVVPTGGGLLRAVADTVRRPGTRLGFWTHYVCCFPPLMFAMMWGVPFLVVGQGRTPAEASALLALHVIASLPCGPIIGTLTARYPYRRSVLVFTVVTVTVVPWVLVLAWPGPAPFALLALLALGLATGGPGSGIGFDYARTFNPPHRWGTANGLVIMGGFGGALVAILLVGLLVDLAEQAFGASPATAYRLAMAVQLPMLLVGVAGVVTSRRAARREEGVVLDPVHRALRRRWVARWGSSPDVG